MRRTDGKEGIIMEVKPILFLSLRGGGKCQTKQTNTIVTPFSSVQNTKSGREPGRENTDRSEPGGGVEERTSHE